MCLISFYVTVILTFDLVSRIIVSGVYLLYYLIQESQIRCVVPFGMVESCIPFWVTMTLTLPSGLISRFFVSGAYLLY